MAEVTASMAGSIWKILVKKDEKVEAGQDVVILESMKMEIPLTTEVSGIVSEIKLKEGDFVNDDDVIIIIDPS